MQFRLAYSARSALFLLALTALLAACSSPTIQQATLTPAIPPTALPSPATNTPAPSPAPFTATPSPTPVPTNTDTPTPTATSQPLRVDSLPDPANYTWSLALEGSQFPVFVTGTGAGYGTGANNQDLYILQQSGQIRVAQQGQILEPAFLDISDRTSGTTLPNYYGERGLLGLAFHPQYADNGYLYVNYTNREGNTVISRFQRSPDNPYQADPASEVRLLQITQPFPNHNGGMLAFGPDGYLYIGLGDGGSGGDPMNNAQSTNSLLGKLLRIDVNQGELYSSPADNPYTAGGGLSEIWAIGLRNPWRFSFDALTGDLYIADVGQNKWEEVNFLPAGSPGGANFGWRLREGMHEYKDQPPAGLVLVEPVAEYGHGPGCSVTGGVVVRSPSLPAWQGVYLYGDYCSGQIWGLLQQPDGAWQNSLLFETGMNITSFGTDNAGEVYIMDYNAGTIYRLAQR